MTASRFQHLDGNAVALTVASLHQRIETQFPGRNIAHIAAALTEPVAAASAAPSRTCRDVALSIVCSVAAVAIFACGAGALALSIEAAVSPDPAGTSGAVWPALVESTVNNGVFAGVAIVFLVNFPRRVRRRTTLRRLHQLRSLAHVIDMHQLAKEPERLMPVSDEPFTGDELTEAELVRYLSFCVELLALVGKAAALHAEQNDDPVVLDTVAEIETLTNGISRGIWQKLSLSGASTHTFA